ncbi:beta-1,3-galactosyltransferase 1-like [Xiphias gladius]|uniref:beta-1,3-galactosyltransferase 1-like n=1 Tax=Xiphias gladius TaxID=8245 RepID=UPI001A982A77|nr:beta-1,3-galactosyltransferase 1-like [Xiphias gladius]
MKAHISRQGSGKMLESGQSRGTADGGTLAESRRWCSWSRRNCFVCILALASVLLVYNTNIKEMATNWSSNWRMEYNATRSWMPFKSQSRNAASPNTTASSASTPGSASDPTPAAATAAGLKAETGSWAFPRTKNSSSINTRDKDKTRPNVSTSAETQQMTRTTSVPYVSPGPYLVEYPYEYRVVINQPRTCERQKPFLVLMVPVAPHNRAHRDIIRNTWGGESLVLGKVVKLFFLLGLHTGEGAQQVQEQLLQESKEYRDLIQSEFLDCYKNLTIKTMVMLEWLDSFCSGASYAMKIDSDMFLNAPNLITMLLNAPKTNYMTGLVTTEGVVLRDPNTKWYLPVEVYPEPMYPHYALGLGYVLSLDLPKKLIEASRHVKAVYIEDVYLGLCMQHLGISPTNPPDWGYFHVLPVQYSRCAYSKLIATTTTENSDRMWMWKDFKRPGSYC